MKDRILTVLACVVLMGATFGFVFWLLLSTPIEH